MKKIMLPAIAILALLAIGLGSCVKQKFDAPPDGSSYDPKIPVNNTILALKSLYGNSPVLIDSDYVISGIVTADDRSGCFYKQIVIQDSTSGIVILLGRSSGLYTDYPIGRKIYVRCKGLYLGAYGGFIQLGYTPDITNSLSDIPSALIPKFIVKANTGNVVTPRTVTINQISTYVANNPWFGTLIRIDSSEFLQTEVNEVYAQDPNIASGTDRHIEDCASNSVVVRMSGYANFRNVLIPTGKGPITSIFSVYNKKTQLLIRDTSDINMRAPRCGGVVITTPIDITIDSLRKLFTATTDTSHITTLGNVQIHGIVTSSLKDSNISNKNLILEDESGKGIVVFYTASYPYKVGDSLTIDVTGTKLIYYRGSLEATGTAAKTKTFTAIKGIVPKVVTISNLNSDLSNPIFSQRQYESVLVKIINCTINNGTPTTYASNPNISDNSGSIELFTNSWALFAGTSCPTSAVSITGISTVYGKSAAACVKQISIRNTLDVL